MEKRKVRWHERETILNQSLAMTKVLIKRFSGMHMVLPYIRLIYIT